MPRVVGVDIPNDKQIVVSLGYLYGIGLPQSRKVLAACGIDETTRAKDLTEDELSRLGAYLERHYVLEGALRRQESQNIAGSATSIAIVEYVIARVFPCVGSALAPTPARARARRRPLPVRRALKR